MNTMTRRVVVGTAVVSMAFAVAACGKTGGGKDNDNGSSKSKGKVIGLLLPDTVTARYEQFDKPLIEAAIKRLCADCTVDYANAAGVPETQAQQVSTLITKGAKVLIVDPQDAAGIQSSVQTAVSKGIKVVSYDRLAEGPVSAYVSYDNVKVGELQGRALLDAMGAKATPQAKIVMINGDDADPNAAQFKQGAHEVLDGKVDIAYEQSGLWKGPVANQKVTAAITQLGAKNIAGVYSANDTMAGGAATALAGQGIKVPLTGQDAQLDAIQRILQGTQTATVFKDYKPEADTTAEIAVDLLNGKDAKSLTDTTTKSGSGQEIPSKLLTAASLTIANVGDIVNKYHYYTVAQICTSEFAKACATAGLK
ncbi:D-xylose transport system substrate-binding protein [Streptomyces sp. DvalAA-14]|uniref:substrate-binding domain-containing protein n=1 Tax=unclassified Streptomyces TaxID=2593676 RepID=UPI00081B64B1|nr:MULTISPECIES: substrate-binding domain-containing protein [unclassified Streptomyces]MYS21667.1 substrate-binding domain-containing protein [Streptomyces sp. SID4948]SCD98245.1 D-xylose transport system substrate-binding protein [Streptomyces sp. DvalAA-14]